MSDANQKPQGEKVKVVVAKDTDMELNDEDLAKVAGGMLMSDGGTGLKSKTIDQISTGHPKPDTD